MIWPPLILAGAIVFLLNPIVTRLQHRHIPRALGTALRLPRRRGRRRCSSCSSSPRSPPGSTTTWPSEWPELREDLEEDINDLSERSEENEWPIRIPTWQELEDQFSAEDAADTNDDGVISDEEQQDRFASRSTPPASWR